MKVLVFGAYGQIGQELQRFENVIALDRSTADLTDPKCCEDLIASTQADANINAAAYTAVDKAEEDEELAGLINGTAPGAMARAAAARDIPFLHISTDYVFEGTGNVPYKPTDATRPLNAYARTKPAGEQAVSIGNMTDHARPPAGGANGTRHDVRPHVDILLRIAHHSGLARGAG